MANVPRAILCISSYFKGNRFFQRCRREGCPIFLLTLDKLRDSPWPREALDDLFVMPSLDDPRTVVKAVAYLLRTKPIDRIVALDEFDMENAAALREHLRIPGMGLTTVRHFRDKLAMRGRAKEEGINVPEFIHVLNHASLHEFMFRVNPPWLLKPRSQASGIGMKKIHAAADLWPLLEQLGDEQSHYLLEQFVPGDVFHVDSIVSESKVVFAEAHAYGSPPLDTSHQGGVFTTRTLLRTAPEVKLLKQMNRDLIEALRLVRGVTHAEFLRAHTDGKFYFIEIASRVGGAYISDAVEAASGVNLWREWARIETKSGKLPYVLPKRRRDYAGVVLSLARQETPDTSAYNDPEIAQRITKKYHAGFILRAPKPQRIAELLDSYSARFRDDFLATAPVPYKPSS
jgi:biotin carboxylase